jgi:hypothetical protein
MNMRHELHARDPRAPRRRRVALLRSLLAGLAGVGAALLVSCGSSGKGLIPAGNAGPLQGDFEAIARAAESGDGNCGTTEQAIRRVKDDFSGLPASVDSGLRSTLRQGISNLRTRALILCAQPLGGATTAGTTSHTTTSTPTTTTTTSPSTTTAQPPTTNTTTSTPTGGGTPAPQPEGSEAEAPAGEKGAGGAGGRSQRGGAGGTGAEGTPR